MNRLVLVVSLMVLSVAVGCSTPQPRTPLPASASKAEKPRERPTISQLLEGVDLDTLKGLYLVVSDADPESASRQPSPPPKTQPLDGQALNAVLKRMPPLSTTPNDQVSFAFRTRSLPPPRPGETIEGSFPPPAPPVSSPNAKKPGPLKVARFQPEGKVSVVPHLSISFSQPMVPLTGHDDLARLDIPVRLTPQPPGTWRWLGTKTLLFEPKPRFPKATKYRVEIPAETTSVLGGKLEKEVSWDFETPPPVVSRFWPSSGPQRLDVPMFIAFDQAVDPASVLKHVTVKAAGQKHRLLLLSRAEIAKSAALGAMIRGAGSDRWVAFRAAEPFARDALVSITVGPSVPSLEGPLRMKERRRFGFRTYPPLKVKSAYCRWRRQTSDCPPGSGMTINFSTPLDMKHWDDALVSVTPSVPGMTIQSQAASIRVTGATAPQATYTVRLNAQIRDIFGQTLGDAAPLTFSYGAGSKALTTNGGPLVSIEPSEDPSFSVYSVNYKKFKLRVHRVEPNDFPKWMGYLQAYRQDKKVPKLPGRKLVAKTITVNGASEAMVETRLALRPYLNKKTRTGHLLVSVEPMKQPKYRWGHRRLHHWIQVSNLALSASIDGDDMITWVSRLADGAPVSGAEVTTTSGPKIASVTSNDAGLAVLPLPSLSAKGKGVVTARAGSDIAILPETTYSWGFNDYGSRWTRRKPGEQLKWYVYNDRGMYKPKETVSIKGFIRRYDAGKRGDVKPFAGAVYRVAYGVIGPRGNRIAKGEVKVSKLGGFHVAFKLPDNVNLGRASVTFSAVGDRVGSTTHRFQIQEFRRPEYEVTAATSAGPHILKGHADATVTASYYTGGGLPGAEVNWNVTQRPTGYQPPNHRAYRFGFYVPWWSRRSSSVGAVSPSRHKGVTDVAGKHTLRIDFPAINPPRATTVTAQASVTDVNRQTWTAQTRFLVHPASHYVGLKPTRSFYEKGKPIAVDLVVTDVAGKRVGGRPIRMVAERMAWRMTKGRYAYEPRDPQTCDRTSATKPARCEFKTSMGGRYRLRATIEDAQGRTNRSEMFVWVSGGKSRPQRSVAMQKLLLVPDKDSYQPGDVAEILVQSPFPDGEGMFTLRRSGIVRTERFKFSGASHTLKIPITEEHLPNVYVHVQAVGAAERLGADGEMDPKLPKRPAYGAGSLNLPVPPLRRRLAVSAALDQDVVAPRGETDLHLRVRDADGQAVSGAEVAVVVVDEAILALSNYTLGDPIAAFYTPRSQGVSDHHSRAWVLLDDPSALARKLRVAATKDTPAKEGGSIGGFGGKRKKSHKGGAPKPASPAASKSLAQPSEGLRSESDDSFADSSDRPIAARTDFNPLAVFVPDAVTDAQGRVKVRITTRDNLTRYRIMVVAADATHRFGTVESAITARRPLMVRPSAPRFLNFGDRFELPVVVQNQTNAPLRVDVAARASNATFTAGAGRRVRVPANDRVEVRLPATTVRPGTARFQVGVVAGRFADAAEVALPVWTPATTEAFATYGVVDDKASVAQPVKVPDAVVKEFGGLEITTSSTALHALTDALIYLVTYRYACSEQLASRVMGVSALRDVLTAFKSPQLPSKSKMEAAVAKDLKLLKSRQHWSGGFSFWRPGQQPWPYVTTYVTHAITKAKSKGYKLPSAMLKRAMRYLRQIESHYPWYYSPEIRRTISSYALYVRHLNGDTDATKARSIVKQAQGVAGLSLDAIGWLYPVVARDSASTTVAEEMLRNLNNRVTETAATAHFAASYSDGAHVIMHSSRRADGIILESLITEDPKNTLIPKIVRGLLAHRKKGRWLNTQENSFILLALDRYFNTYEKATPDFVARAWLGKQYAGDYAFKGRTTERHQIHIPMPWVAKNGGRHQLVLQKDGVGRMYYRLGMRYAPASLRLDAADHGFTVRRGYEGVDDPKDVMRRDGAWYIRAGAKVRVNLTMVAPTRRYHVALVDQLPAGLEPLNPALAVSGDVQPPRPRKRGRRSRFWWWSRTWYEHQNLRDERAEAFTSILWGGVHSYSYVATATTPGRFVTPPAKAEEMYFPETFGRSASDIVHVVDALPPDER